MLYFTLVPIELWFLLLYNSCCLSKYFLWYHKQSTIIRLEMKEIDVSVVRNVVRCTVEGSGIYISTLAQGLFPYPSCTSPHHLPNDGSNTFIVSKCFEGRGTTLHLYELLLLASILLSLITLQHSYRIANKFFKFDRRLLVFSSFCLRKRVSKM